VADPWAWLRNRDDPDTMAYLGAENAYADRWFQGLESLVEAIVGEIRQRTVETDRSAPVRIGGHVYAVRTVAGSSYGIHVRRPLDADRSGPADGPDPAGGPDPAEDVLLDENREAEGHPYHDLGAFEVSPGGHRLAWSVDHDGDEVFRLRVRDLTTGVDGPHEVAECDATVAWLDDSTLLFTVPDDALRPHEVWRWRVDEPGATAERVFHEPDERFVVRVERTRSGRFAVVTTESHTTSEVWLLPTADPTAALRCVARRVAGVEYAVDDDAARDRLVITTNLDAEDFRVMVAPTSATDPAQWSELVPHVPGRRITGAAAFADAVVVDGWADASPFVARVRPDGTLEPLGPGDAAGTVELGPTAEYTSPTVRIEVQSLVSPPVALDVLLDAGPDTGSGTASGRERTRVVKRTRVPGFDSERYVAERVLVPSTTAGVTVQVPLDICRARTTPVDGSAPCVLVGYGAYEIPSTPRFSVPRLSLLDRGVVWALAHPRGGGELGRAWYLDGKLDRKPNTFADFLACADWLVDRGYADPGRLACRGGSAGGLLVTAAMTTRPDRFAAVVAEVPFVDVVTTMSDPTLPLTVGEWEEWGDPRRADDEAAIAAWSPYDAIGAARYPALYATAGLNDPRVGYHEPAKFVAKLRAVASGGPFLLRTELGAGHGGPSGRYDAWRDEARTLAFLLRALGVVDGAGRPVDPATHS
jgi:oligopeptidase B